MRLLLPLTVSLAAFALSGCALLGIHKTDAGSDPFVVSAETTIRQAHSTARAFLQLDSDNRAFVAANLPVVHAFAESLRAPDPATGKPMEIAADAAAFESVQAYKATRAPTDQQAVTDSLAKVEALADKARSYLAAILQAKASAQKAKPASQPAAPSIAPSRAPSLDIMPRTLYRV